MNSSQSEDADNTKREPRQRRRNRLGGAVMAAVFGSIAFSSVASKSRFETFHTLDVIRLMTAGAGFAVALTLLIDFSFPGPLSANEAQPSRKSSPAKQRPNAR